VGKRILNPIIIKGINMANLANKYKLGVFVVIAFIVFIIALFLLGSFKFMEEKIKCVTIVKSSVQGLSIGAKVKFSGVPLGQITDIKIAHGNYIYIYMELFTDKLINSEFQKEEVDYREYFEELVKKGLRCQLCYQGITGTLYQELQFFDPKQYKKIIPLHKEGILYIPSIPPVLVSSIIRRIDNSLNKISGANDIFKEVTVALGKINKYLENPEINDTIKNFIKISNNIKDISTSLKSTLSENRMDIIVNELISTTKEIKRVAGNLNRNINESKLPETSETARVLMRAMEKQLNDAVVNFNTTAQSMKNLTDKLENNPSELIWGTNKEKVLPSY
jgi:paraquat-inducible protein B